jgi:hypothetical protein
MSKNPGDMTAEELKEYFSSPELRETITSAQETAARVKFGHQGARGKSPNRGPTDKLKFIMFPVEWQFQLARVDADKCTYRVALYLLHESWRSKNKYVKLANVGLKRLGVGREGKGHALEQLEEAGLVSVERKDRKSPVVTVKFINWG